MKDRIHESQSHPKALDGNTYKRILVIAPHPDDETQGCAGLARLAIRNGARVHAIVLTNGDPSGHNFALQQIRIAESKAAAHIIGMTIEFFGLLDRGLRSNSGIDLLLQKSIAEFNPDLLICTSITEPHPDHQVACLSVITAATASGYYGDIGFYESGGALIQPTHLAIIDEAADDKYQALQCFESQENVQPYLSRIKARDHFRALQFGPGVEAAEAFEIFSLQPSRSAQLHVHLSPLLTHSQHRACSSNDIPTISVIIRTTGDSLLEKAVASALIQTLPPYEVILVHAKQGLVLTCALTHACVKAIPTDIDLNRAEAANTGLAHATGELAIFLDEDDYFLPTHLEDLHKQLQRAPGAVAALSQTLMVDYEGNELRLFDYTYLPNRLLLENLYPIHSILFRIAVVRHNHLQFSKDISTLEDWDFWIQLSQHGAFVESGKCTCVYVYANRSGAGTSGSAQVSAHQAVISRWLGKLGQKRFIQAATEAVNRLSVLEKLHGSLSSEVSSLTSETANTHKALLEANTKLAQTHAVHESYTLLLLNQISKLSTDIANSHSQLDTLRNATSHHVTDLNSQIASLTSQLLERQQEIVRLCLQNNATMASHSMQITKPFRDARRYVSDLGKRRSGIGKSFINGVRYLARGDFSGFYSRMMAFWSHSSTAPVYSPTGAPVCIISTEHAMYVAELLASNLRSLGFKSDIRTSYTPESDEGGLHIVLCAQMFSQLPPGERRIIFQLEQLVNDAWHSNEYFKTLENSLAVFEYSRANLKVLSDKGINYPHVFYTPLGALPRNSVGVPQPNASRSGFLFYGSWKPSQRRCDALNTLDAHGIAVKKVDNIFGSALRDDIVHSTAVINIHHNATNIMEAPRVWECISLGTPVVSEPSTDSEDFADASPAICFSAEQTPASLVACVADWTPPSSADMADVQDHSHRRQLFFAQRALVATGMVDAEGIDFAYPFATPLSENTPVVLSLPETFKRRDAFKSHWPARIPHLVFDGLRHKRGWVGCALSYRTLARWAVQQDLQRLIIVEDDVLLPPDFADKFPRLLAALEQTNSQWDVYCGLIAVIDEPVHCLRRQHIEPIGHDLLLIDRFKSMVFNVFNRSTLDYMASWSLDKGDEHTNTIDMYLDQMPGIRTVVSYPFIVGHATELQSTLWGISNSTYDPLIAKTQDTIGKLPVQEPGVAI